jgi:hypothetical protein
MSTETFFSYRGYRWMWICLGTLLACAAVYILDNPVHGRNGSTTIGYTYGSLAALGILYLMWFGIRKRAYYAHATTLKGCLAAHVWLGLALVVLVPLHCAFSFGWNVHTLAYVLMTATVLSGLWGAIQYVRFAPAIHSHRGGGTPKRLIEQLDLLRGEVDAMAREKSDAFLKLLHLAAPSPRPGTHRWEETEPAREEVAALVAALPDAEREEGVKLVTLASRRFELARELRHEVSVTNRMRAWLFLHVPLSFALLAALAIHIFSVFYYR